MKIRITERQLDMLTQHLYENYLKEDGGMVGGAAANASGTLNGATNSQMSSNAQFDVPFMGGVMRKKGYSPKDPTLKRKDGKNGSISIPKKRA